MARQRHPDRQRRAPYIGLLELLMPPPLLVLTWAGWLLWTGTRVSRQGLTLGASRKSRHRCSQCDS